MLIYLLGKEVLNKLQNKNFHDFTNFNDTSNNYNKEQEKEFHTFLHKNLIQTYNLNEKVAYKNIIKNYAKSSDLKKYELYTFYLERYLLNKYCYFDYERLFMIRKKDKDFEPILVGFVFIPDIDAQILKEELILLFASLILFILFVISLYYYFDKDTVKVIEVLIEFISKGRR